MRESAFSNNMEEYATKLGKIEVNLRSLEVVIRTFLLIHQRTYKEAVKFNKSLRKLKRGKEVENNPFTNHCSFSQLVNEYNDIVSSSPEYCGLEIDSKLKSFRNAMAHGRFFYENLLPPYKTMLLLQFSDPSKNPTNKPIVEFHEKMTTGWLNKKMNWVQDEYFNVVKACNIVEKNNP
jgi:hypothetical protein